LAASFVLTILLRHLLSLSCRSGGWPLRLLFWEDRTHDKAGRYSRFWPAADIDRLI